MTAQLHEAYVIVQARTLTGEDRALLRDVELSRPQSRRIRWGTRRVR